MKRRLRPPSIRKIRATHEVAWEPLRLNAKTASTSPVAQPCQALQAQRKPVAGLANQQSIAMQTP
jgi:hypothetical protein